MLSEGKSLGVTWQIDLSASIDRWLKTTYRSRYCTLCRLRNHSARFYVTNYDKPLHLFDCRCTVLCALMAPCWLITAPFYKVHLYTLLMMTFSDRQVCVTLNRNYKVLYLFQTADTDKTRLSCVNCPCRRCEL